MGLLRHRSARGISAAGAGAFLLISAAGLMSAGPAYASLLTAAATIGVGECFHTTALMPLVADMAPAGPAG